MFLKFTVPGVPVPKARARVTTAGGKTHAYTPKRTKDYEAKVAARAREAIRVMPCADFPVSDPLAMRVTFFLKSPKSRRKWQLWPAKRPDWDNLAKAVTDAMNALVYRDDAQIVDAQVSKRYAADGDEPHALVTVWTAGTRRYEG